MLVRLRVQEMVLGLGYNYNSIAYRIEGCAINTVCVQCAVRTAYTIRCAADLF